VNRTKPAKRKKGLDHGRLRVPPGKIGDALNPVDPSARRQAHAFDLIDTGGDTDKTFPNPDTDRSFRTSVDRSPIGQILVPVDAVHTKLSDLIPILLMACRFEAKVTLLHCYVVPPSFDFAIGDTALSELSLHCGRVRTRLYELASQARKLYFSCSGRFALGAPSVEILRQSREVKADLIAVPLPLDLISWCWLPEELLDELVRKADCPVLCVPAALRSPIPEPVVEPL
jgi:hypothetical protein